YAPNDQCGPWGLINIDGNIVLPPVYFSIGPFVTGLAPAAKEKKKFGFINTQGEWMIPPVYQQALPFDDGLAWVTVPGKHRNGNKGFIDRTGEMVIPPRFFRQSSFHNGWALVEFEGKQQVINRTGEIIWEAPCLH